MFKIVIKALLPVFVMLVGMGTPLARTTAIGFFVSDGHTGVLAQGVNEFTRQYPKKIKDVRIAVYTDLQLGDTTTKPDFASFDIMYLHHLRFDVMTKFEGELGDAAKRGTRIIGMGGYDVFRQKGLYNVDLAVYPELEEYWEYSGAENVKRLIAFLLHRFADDRDVRIELPVVQPKDGIYHPDYAANELFTSPAAYRKWYMSKKYRKNAPWIGIPSYNLVKTGNAKVQDELIRVLEKEGMNVLCAVGYPVDFVIEKYMMSGDIDIDVIISMMMSHPKEEALQLFMKKNVPILNAHALYTSLEKWKEDPQGIPPFMLAPHVVMPELNGAIEPMVIGGKHTWVDKKTGISITESIPHQERIGRLVARAKSWARLSSKKNTDKRLAIMYYNHPPGKSNVGASYLDIFASMQALLQRLANSGYKFRTDSAFTKETLQELVLEQGRNIGSWAPGEMEKLVESGRVVMLPVKKYREWFKALPQEFQKKVNKEWGAVEESALMTWTDRRKKKYIVIPGIRMGNVFIGPQPARGSSEDQEKLYHSTEMPPHHQYIAFYLWLKKEFHADAMIHFGTHGTLEWLPGKQVGLSGECAPDILLQDVPDIYPYIVDNIGEGTQAKRRGAAVIISHNVPAFKKSDIYEEYVEIHDNIHRYMEVKEVTPRLAEKYREAIITEAKKLGIGKDMKLDLDKTPFDEVQEKVHNYLHQLEYIQIPYGLHVFGKPLEGEALATTVNEMLGVEGDIPSLGTIIGMIIGEDYAKVRVQAHKYCKILDKIESLRESFLRQVIIEKKSAAEAASVLFGDAFERSPNATKSLLFSAEKLALRYAENLQKNDNELKSVIRACNAEYIEPSTGNDPIRNPDALPTGRNFYGFDPRKIPTKAAWEVGKRMAEEVVNNHRQKNGDYPDKIGLVLWATETFRHHGIMESKVLYLLGVQPVWDGRGNVMGVELIPEKKLKRPRIDIVVNASGLYRDVFPEKLEMIDDAVQLVLDEKEGDYKNFARLNMLEAHKAFVKKGFGEKEAAEMARYRIFSDETGNYGTGLSDAIEASDSWDNDKKLSEIYLDRQGFAYGRNVWGKSAKEAFKTALTGTDLIIHSRSSNLVGVVDNDDFYQYMGGMAMTVRNLTGQEPDLVVSDNRDPSAGGSKPVDFSTFLGLETRSRYLNPKWITGMKEHGYSGASKMEKFVDYLWGWQVTTPKEVSAEMWQQVNDVYVNDKYNLEIKRFFEKHNPHAWQGLTARILEIDRKGYQKFDERLKQKLASEYIKSVVEHGMACGVNTCRNSILNQFAANMIKVPGLVAPEVMKKFEEQVNETTGKQVTVHAWVDQKLKEKKTETNKGAKRNMKSGKTGTEKMEKVKGYEVKEVKDRVTKRTFRIGMGLIIALFALGLTLFGWYRAKRARE